MAYCINSECPFRDCEKHLSKSKSKGKVYVANFDGICKRYITCMLKECEECMKDAPYEYCCKLECGEHEFCRRCRKADCCSLIIPMNGIDKGWKE